MRLEVREGSVDGPLIDSLGGESAGQTHYLVKRGPVYQAYSAHGEALNGVPRRGTTFLPRSSMRCPIRRDRLWVLPRFRVVPDCAGQ
ncbi:hypothetical protein V5O39_07180 [Pseudomonas parakoreensis]